MGSLRTLFALSVVFAHCWPGGPALIGGRNAVQLFYMISGFLISYVLVERKAYATRGAFYLNRYLRLYPIYAVVAACSLGALLLTGDNPVFKVYRFAPGAATALLTFSNLFMLGQDWVMFAGVRNDSLVPTANFNDSDVVLYHGLLIPQAWTLGVELTFYLIAPWVLPRRGLMYLLLAGSLLLRVLLVAFGPGADDPWTYRFFPNELALFLAGALAHQLLLPLYRRLGEARLASVANIATAAMVGVSILFPYVPVPEAIGTGALFVIFLALLPATFAFQARHKLDRWLGELSYPLYIVHVLVIESLRYLTGDWGAEHTYALALISIGASVVCALALGRFVAQPVEGIRDRLRSRIRGRTAPAVPLEVRSS